DRSLQKKHRRQAASHSPWSLQDSGITLSTSMGMIGVLEITLIVPTLRAHRYTQVLLEEYDDDRSYALRGNAS
ncbi:hypothetical protein, partial [Pseudomonas viridiflava]|uniref:hypothetical protein n=1 Tax=Pseudomonas viridiflava TaxID=33069 RepID=UPI001E4E603A